MSAKEGNFCQGCGALGNLETYQYIADRSYELFSGIY